MNKGINEIIFNGKEIKFISDGYEIQDFYLSGNLVISYDDGEYEDIDESKPEAIKGKILRGYFCPSQNNRWKVETRKPKQLICGNIVRYFNTRQEAEKFIHDFENE